jgi:transcriptional regulator with XRE-family HTH domain
MPPAYLPVDVRDRLEVVQACHDRDIGRLFRLINNLTDGPAQFTASHIARRCGLSPSRVAEYMKGERRVSSVTVIVRIADGLRIPGVRFQLDRRPWEASEPQEGRVHTGYPSGWEELGEMRRRVLLAGGLAASVPMLNLDELTRLAAAVDDARRYMDGPVAAYFHRQLDSCATSDGKDGPKQTLPSVLGIIAAIESNARQVKVEARRELIAVAARAAEFAGWLYRDTGELASTGYWHDRAMEWAQECGDTAMQGYVLLKKSQAAWDARDGARMHSLALAAQGSHWKLPRQVVAEAVQQEARALALTGEGFEAVAAKLDQARTLLDQTDGAGESTLGAHYSPALLDLQSAICYVEAGRPQMAIDIYRAHLDAGELSKRDGGYFSVLMGHALVAAHEPDEAARVGQVALDVAVATRSARTISELGRLAKGLEDWRPRPAVRELYDALGA